MESIYNNKQLELIKKFWALEKQMHEANIDFALIPENMDDAITFIPSNLIKYNNDIGCIAIEDDYDIIKSSEAEISLNLENKKPLDTLLLKTSDYIDVYSCADKLSFIPLKYH